MEYVSDFDTAQICLNGHIVNLSCKNNPANCSNHCSKCGEKTITACPHCNTPIKGDGYREEFLFAIGDNVSTVTKRVDAEYERPAFCHKCGKPYPWSERLMEEANTIIDSFDSELSEEQRAILKERFPDLLTDNPQTTSAVLAYNRLINGLKNGASMLGKSLLIDLLEKHIPETIFTMMNLH